MYISAFDLTTHLGAFLFRENHFNKNGLVGFAAMELLDGYIDVSGNEMTVADKLLTVNGLLSTPLKWQEFDIEWQKYLKEKNFKPDPKTGYYVFHTSSFNANNWKLMPDNLTGRAKQVIYNHLVDLIAKHTVYRFGYAVLLDDFRRVEADYPHVRESWLRKSGTRMSMLCFKWNSVWADKNNYNDSISYVFDRGDIFFGELYSEYRAVIKKEGVQDSSVASLTEGNKAMFSPLQAADILAWECRKYFLRRLVGGKINRLASGILPSSELGKLNIRGKSDLRLYDGNDLRGELRDAMNDIISDDSEETLIGDGKPFKDFDDYIRGLFRLDKDDKIAEMKASQAEARARKAKNKTPME